MSCRPRRVIATYRQEIIQDIRLFISQPIAKFYDSFFLNLDLSNNNQIIIMTLIVHNN